MPGRLTAEARRRIADDLDDHRCASGGTHFCDRVDDGMVALLAELAAAEQERDALKADNAILIHALGRVQARGIWVDLPPSLRARLGEPLDA